MPTKCKAAVLNKLGGPFEIEEVIWDDPRPDEVLVRVSSCGLCHSDWHSAVGANPVEFPIVAGHEGAGVIEKVGDRVTRFKVGEQVVMSWEPSCGHCKWCVEGQGQLCERGATVMLGPRDDGSYRIKNQKGETVYQFAHLGAFSEYVVIPEDGCIPVPQDIDLKPIPLVGCRIPTGWGAVVHAAHAKHGCTALVVGLGGIGFAVIEGLVSVDAEIIIAADIIADKKQWALDWGATHFIDASKQDIVEEVMKITGIGVDYAFDAYGDPAVEAQTIQAIHKGGTATWIGIPGPDSESVNLNSWVFVQYQKNVVGTLYGNRSPHEMAPLLLKMYQAGKVKMDKYITQWYKLEDINKGYEDMLAGKNISGAIDFSL